MHAGLVDGQSAEVKCRYLRSGQRSTRYVDLGPCYALIVEVEGIIGAVIAHPKPGVFSGFSVIRTDNFLI